MAERSRKGMAGRTGRLIMNKEEKEMTNKERRDAGMAYVSDDSVFKELINKSYFAWGSSL